MGYYFKHWLFFASFVYVISTSGRVSLLDLSELFFSEFVMGKAVEDMQVGCLWQGDFILSVSVSGHINYLDRNNADGNGS